jgi:hypothetical protein
MSSSGRLLSLTYDFLFYYVAAHCRISDGSFNYVGAGSGMGYSDW